MKYRIATILDAENHTADTTKVIDLNLTDPVSQLVIIYKPMNGAEGASQAHPAACITKIELVDGSDVLFSLTGQEAQAADWYHRKQEPFGLLWYLEDNASEMCYNINFGRFLYDPLLAFDPTKFTNPQLKISIDINGGGCNCDSGYLTVLAHIFDEKAVTPEGFLMHKEIKDYTLASEAHEYTDMPTDYPYRKMFAKILAAGLGTEYCFGNIKLSEDNDKRIPVNHSIGEILHMIVGQTRPYREWIITHGTTGFRYYHNTCAYFSLGVSCGWTAAATPQAANVYDADGGRFRILSTGAGANQGIIFEGHCPHGVIEIPFGLQEDPADWYDVSKLGSLRLDLLSANAMSDSYSCQIFLQQLRKYA